MLEVYMIKLGIIYNVIDDETLQIEDLDDDELYEIKGSTLYINEIRENIEDSVSSELLVEFDDETMEIVV